MCNSSRVSPPPARLLQRAPATLDTRRGFPPHLVGGSTVDQMHAWTPGLTMRALMPHFGGYHGTGGRPSGRRACLMRVRPPLAADLRVGAPVRTCFRPRKRGSGSQSTVAGDPTGRGTKDRVARTRPAGSVTRRIRSVFAKAPKIRGEALPYAATPRAPARRTPSRKAGAGG